MKLALITGATKGIGRSTAQTFARAGWNLILLGRDIRKLQDLQNELSNNDEQMTLSSWQRRFHALISPDYDMTFCQLHPHLPSCIFPHSSLKNKEILGS